MKRKSRIPRNSGILLRNFRILALGILEFCLGIIDFNFIVLSARVCHSKSTNKDKI